MFKRPRIDREDELILLDQLALGQIIQRILLIKAGAGMGKSELLREFIARCSRDIFIAILDFKNGSISQTDLLYNICETFGWQYFPRLDSKLKNLMDLPDVNISENVLLGQNRINVLLGGFDRQTRAEELASLTRAFFEDVRRLRRVVFIFDTFENADSLLKEWVINTFLHYANLSPNLSIIISGREVPKPTLEWIDISHHLELEGIDAIHWYSYAQSIGLQLNLEWIKGCCFVLKGHPLYMAQILSRYSEE